MDRIINVSVGGNYLRKDNKKAGVRGEANVTRLRIAFDEGWDNYAKKITFLDARGLNPVNVVLGVNLIENIVRDRRVYLVPIPAEPMAEAGWLTFVIEGTLNNKVQKSFADKLEVKDAPDTDDAVNAVDPVPSEVEQIQTEIEYIKDNIHDAVEAKEAIQNMSVSAETLRSGEQAFVEKTEKDGVVNLHYGLPAGNKGDTGDSGVYLGSDEPTDPNVNVWIDPDGDGFEVGDVEGFGSLITSVKSFGAVGDGVTDDTAALREAAGCGKAVFFPAGTYLLLGQIDMTADINWYGVGAESIIKLMPYDQSRPEEYDGHTVYNCYMIKHANGENKYSISLQGLVLDANKEAYKNDVYGNGSCLHDHTTCLDLHNPKSVSLYNVEVRNALIEGCYILSQNGAHINISECSFTNNGEYQVDASGLHIEGNGENAFISNCKFDGNGFHGLLLVGVYGASVANISCRNNGYGGVALWGGSSQNTLSGVCCSGNLYGVLFKASFSSNCQDDSYDNTWMMYAANNTITGLTTVGNVYGIVFCNCEKNIISGWNCVKDEFAYFIGYGNADKDITGSVFAILDYTTAKEAHDIVSTDRFKIKFIGE